MRKLCIVLGIVLLLSTTASATVVSVGMADGRTGEITVTIGETIQIAMFVTDVANMAGFDAYVNVVSGAVGMPHNTGHGCPLEWEGELVEVWDWVGDPPVWTKIGEEIQPVGASMGVWFNAAANSPGKSGVQPEAALATAVSLTAMMAQPTPPMQGYVGGSGDIAIYPLVAMALGDVAFNVDTENTVLGSDMAEGIPYTIGSDLIIHVVPEPATMVLLASGLLGLVAYKRRK